MRRPRRSLKPPARSGSGPADHHGMRRAVQCTSAIHLQRGNERFLMCVSLCCCLCARDDGGQLKQQSKWVAFFTLRRTSASRVSHLLSGIWARLWTRRQNVICTASWAPASAHISLAHTPARCQRTKRLSQVVYGPTPRSAAWPRTAWWIPIWQLPRGRRPWLPRRGRGRLAGYTPTCLP